MTARFVPQVPLNRRTIATVAIAIVVGFAAGQSVEPLLKLLHPPSTENVSSPAIAPQPRPVTALGRLVPQGEVLRLSAPVSVEGVRIDRLSVDEGDFVNAGEVVAVLDNLDRRTADLELAQARVEAARSRLAQVEAGAKTGDIEAQAARFERVRAELEGQIASQRAHLAELEASRQGELAEQSATLDRIDAEVRYAKTECRRYDSLYRDGAVSASERDRLCLNADTAEERLSEAVATRDRIATTRNAEIRQAQAELERTTTTLQRQIEENRATLNAIAEVRPVDVRTAETEVRLAEAEVLQAEADLEQSFVRSPVAGRVLEIHARTGEVVGDAGILEVGHTQSMEAIAEVYQTDIGRVELGQKATITSPVFEGELEGEVVRLGTQVSRQEIFSTQPGSDVDRRVVEVRIRLTPDASDRVRDLTHLQIRVSIQPSR
ncbi:ABC exporter membrane fusion protein [Baaleninema simplex]|uniref:ABC exporter membrane fusion protein n=1 Tax=Baaleninema simplex TaxID=2862350 RepID=UPI00034C74E5|nr:ABC exporter membrane fusion protein [Baaleninema simplex]